LIHFHASVAIGFNSLVVFVIAPIAYDRFCIRIGRDNLVRTNAIAGAGDLKMMVANRRIELKDAGLARIERL
jgi:hypothetical protein